MTILPALLTPFRRGRPTTDGLDALVTSVCAAGCTEALALGVTGEVGFISARDRETFAAESIALARGRLSLIVNATASAPSEAARLADAAMDAGARAVLIQTPAQPGMAPLAGLHVFAEVLRAHGKHAVVYCSGFLGAADPGAVVDTVRAAHEIYGVTAAKVTHMDLALTAALRDAAPAVALYHGRDETLGFGLALGAQAAMGSTYNLFPAYAKAIAGAVARGDLAETARLQTLLLRGIHALVAFDPHIPWALKTALGHLGVDLGETPHPAAQRDPGALAELLRFLDGPDGRALTQRPT